MDNFSDNGMSDRMKERKKRKAIILFGSIGAAVLIGIVVIVVFSYYYMNRSFSGYDVVRESPRTDSNNVTYMPFEGNLLKYSRDGISVLDDEGKTLWNAGYEMEHPQIDICEDHVVAADIGSKKCYVYSGDDQGKEIETNLPIGSAKVSSDGKVAVLLHDEDSDVVNIYDPYNTVEQLDGSQ